MALLFGGAVGAAALRSPLGRKWSFPWAATENAVRDGLPLTALILARLGAAPGQRIADVGAGAGYFTFKLARVVGPHGHVLATDARADACVRLLYERARRDATNVSVRFTLQRRLMLPREQFDRVMMVDVFAFRQGLTRRNRALLRQAAAALRPGGLLLVAADTLHTTDHVPPYGGRISHDDARPEEIVALARAHFELASLDASPASPACQPERGRSPGYVLALRRRGARAA